MTTELTGYSDGEVDTNRSGNRTLTSIVEERYSRRQTLFGGIGAITMAALGTSLLTACGEDNDAPSVSAGTNGTSSSGRIVTLTGTATDDGSVTTTAWTQTAGPTVTLNNANTAVATFLAPSVSAATDLKFNFTATDDKVATVLRSYWLNFIKTGDPNGAGMARWQPFDPARDEVMVLSEAPHMRPIATPQKTALWRRRYEPP